MAVEEHHPEWAAPKVGRVIAGRYKLDAVLGVGGMGAVYSATQLAVDRSVALKILRPERMGDDAAGKKAAARFQREAKAVAALSHPNIVALHDFGTTTEGLTFMVMEKVDGDTLNKVLRKNGPLPAARIVHLLSQLSEALAYAHDHGIVHRDLKPANLMVTEVGARKDVLKLLDFGIAITEADDVTLTGPGNVIGSPQYMSPEQCRGERATAQSDLYSMAIIGYQMLTGLLPFNSSNRADLFVSQLTQPPPHPSRRGEPLNGPLVELLLDCLVKDPRKRPESAASVLEQLRAMDPDMAAVVGTFHTDSYEEPAPTLVSPELQAQPFEEPSQVEVAPTQAMATPEGPEAALLHTEEAPSTDKPVEPPDAEPEPEADPKPVATFDEAPPPQQRSSMPTYALVAAVVLLVAGGFALYGGSSGPGTAETAKPNAANAGKPESPPKKAPAEPTSVPDAAPSRATADVAKKPKSKAPALERVTVKTDPAGAEVRSAQGEVLCKATPCAVPFEPNANGEMKVTLSHPKALDTPADLKQRHVASGYLARLDPLPAPPETPVAAPSAPAAPTPDAGAEPSEEKPAKAKKKRKKRKKKRKTGRDGIDDDPYK